MSQKITAGLAEGIVVGDGFIIRFRAIDPSTGADVSGVVVSDVNIDGDDAGSGNVTVKNPILVGINT